MRLTNRLLVRSWPGWLTGLMFGAVLYPMWLGRFFIVGDIRDVFIPLETFFRSALLAGSLPAWWPEAAWGYPAIASAQLGFFYPPLFILRILPVAVYLPILLYAHLAAAAFGMFLFLRAKQRSPLAAWFGGITFGASQFFIEHITHLNIIFTAAWLPWQFIAARRLLVQPSPRALLWLAVTIGVPFLAGQIQIPVLMALMTSAYVMFYSVRTRRSLSSLRRLAIVAVVAFGIAAAQLLPTAELASVSSRGSTGDFTLETANQYSFPLYHLPTLLFPRFFGADDAYWGKRLEIEYGIFLGTAPLLLAVWSLRKRSIWRTFWPYLALGTFLLALGGASPVRLLGIEPSLWFFSAPARWLLGTVAASSILAAYGLDELRRSPASFQRFAGLLAALIGLAVVAANIFVATVPPERTTEVLSAATRKIGSNEPYYTAKAAQLVDSFMATGVTVTQPAAAIPLTILLAIPYLTGRKRTAVVLTVVTALELTFIGATTLPHQPWAHALAEPETVALLPEPVRNTHERLVSLSRDTGDTGAFFTNPASRADAVSREQTRRLLVPLTHTQFDLAGVSWPASLHFTPQSLLLDQIRLDLNAGDAATAAAANIGSAVSDYRLPAPLTPLANEFPYVYDLPAAPTATFTGDGGQVLPAQYHGWAAQRAEVVVNAPTAGHVRVANTWYPGWQAKLNGVNVPVTADANMFQQIPVAAGTHHIMLFYRPMLLWLGMIISAASIALIAGTFYKGWT